jgi:hypothetical protein
MLTSSEVEQWLCSKYSAEFEQWLAEHLQKMGGLSAD